MKALLLSLAAILTVILIGGGVLVFGPYRNLLPQGARTTVDATIPDYFKVNARPTVIVPPGTDSPLGGSATGTISATGSTTWVLPGMQEGLEVIVRRFSEESAATSSAEGGDLPEHNVFLVTQASSSAYSIQYFAQDKSFMIGLMQEPLSETRKSAEQHLLQILGITQEMACTLRYAVSVPIWLNTFYAGKNLGFSFCPGAVPL